MTKSNPQPPLGSSSGDVATEVVTTDLSISRRPQTPESVLEVLPQARFAKHALAPLLQGTADICASALTASAPICYLAHLTDGALDFDFVLRDRIPDANPVTRQPDPSSTLQRVSQRVRFVMQSLDGFLSQALTGDLLRVVVQGPAGTILCDQVLVHQHLVSVQCHQPYPDGDQSLTTERPGVRTADIELGRVCDQLRDQAGVAGLNLGGWHTATPQFDETALPAAGEVVAAFLDEASEAGSRDDVPAEVLAKALHPKRLQFLALVGPDGVLASADLLDDRSLNHFALRLAPDSRRRFYYKVAERIREIRRQLGGPVRSVTGEVLERLVLDVEQGAMYVHRLDDLRYLLGVALLQRSVADSDDDLARLAVRIRAGQMGV